MKVKLNPFVSTHSRRKFISGVTKGGCGLALLTGATGLRSAGSTSEIPARFFEKMDNKAIQCRLCFRQCILEPGDIGECEVRINRDGTLFTMAYGNPGAVNVDPIEKKPLFHYLPGTMAYSIATVGCNIDCKFCQNWQIAQAKPGQIQTRDLPPDLAAREAKSYGCPTIAYTYSEPTVWSEYVLDCSSTAQKRGIGSVVISNGTWHPSVLDELLKTVRAIKIDLKSIEPAYYRDVCDAELQPVLDNIVRIKKSGVWLELVNLVVTTLNDSDDTFKKMVRWIKTHIGMEVPIHFTRFHPMYRLKNLAPTPIQALDHAYDIARSEGLNYVYVGNVPGHRGQHTLCPGCGRPVIERHGYYIKENRIIDGACAVCKTKIHGTWV
jgi:pyruvate formate lyase activating enzyme